MVKKKKPEVLKSPMSSPTQANSAQNDSDIQVIQVEKPNNGASHDLLTGYYNEVGQGMNAGIPYHQPPSAIDGAPHEQASLPPLRVAARVQRLDPVDDEPSSRARMWDPVKDCSDPNTIQADLHDFLPARHNGNEQTIGSTLSGVDSMGFHFCHGDPPYGQARENRQQATNLVPRGAASMGLLSFSQTQAMALGYQGSASMGPQPLQVGHPYDQIQRSHQHQSGYGNASISLSHLTEPSGQDEEQSLDPLNRGAAPVGIQFRQTGHLNNQSQGSGYQFMGMESRVAASTASHLPTYHRENFNNSGSYSSPSGSPNLPRRRSPDSHQAIRLQGQSPSQTANMSKALNIAQYAKTMEQQSNFTEALHAYQQACALLQEVIIRSCSLKERTECDNARNFYQARIEVLLRESAGISSNTPPEQNDKQDNDDPGRGKPQYSLLEDFALCHKEEEDLRWQEVAETLMFKGKRKHRSLSQRKHTIGKMGPKYSEAEEPWTEEENRKLCALGDAGKTLGDIHRKFRSRNAERCLNRYFHLKGFHTASRSHTRTSHQARQAPALYPLSTQHTHFSSVVARHRGYGRGYGLHSSTSVIDPIPHRRSLGTVLQQSYRVPRLSSQNIPSVFPPRLRTPGMLSLSSSCTGAETANYSTASISLNNAASTEPHTTRTQGSSSTSRQQRLAAFSSSSSHSGAEPPTYSTPPMPPDNPSSPEVVGNESLDDSFTSRRQRPATSSSSSSASTANSPTDSTPLTSTSNSPATTTPPLEIKDAPASKSAAANRVRKSRRPAHLEGS